jgi:hypothetical protein
VAVVLVMLAMFGQELLAALAREVSGWYGTLHVVNGMVIGGLANRLREGASRRQRPATTPWPGVIHATRRDPP